MNRRTRKKKQQIKSEELWELDLTISKFILPRLILFKESINSRPIGMTTQEWQEILGKMIYAFQYTIDDDKYKTFPSDYPKYEEGINLFAKYFRDLWI